MIEGIAFGLFIAGVAIVNFILTKRAADRTESGK